MAITEDISLYKMHNKEIGRQFFRYCQGLSPLGIQLIRDCLHVVVAKLKSADNLLIIGPRGLQYETNL